MNATKKRVREGVVGKSFYLDEEIDKALLAFIESHELPPSQTAIFEAAMKAYLKEKGFWPPKE